MLEVLGTIFGSIFSGGATGIIGVIAQRYADYKNKQLDIELEDKRSLHALQLKNLEAKISQQEAEAALKVVTVENEAKMDLAASDTFKESYKFEPKQYSNADKLTPAQNWLMVMLDAFRGSIRPALTLYLCGITTIIYFQAREVLGVESISQEQAYETYKLIISTVLYLTTTVILWWFGTRNKTK